MGRNTTYSIDNKHSHNKLFFIIAFAFVLVFLTLILTNGCLGAKHREERIQPTFKSTVLQDSLDYFMSRLGGFPNPYGPVIFTVSFCHNEEDTLVCFIAYGYLIEPRRFNSEGFWQDSISGTGIGARFINDNVLAIESIGLEKLDQIVNVDVLSLELYDQYYKQTEELHSKSPWDGWEPIPSERYYKLVGTDSLLLLKARHSIYERSLLHKERTIN